MMKTTSIALLLSLAGLVLLTSCNKLEYTGDEFAPTDSVIVFLEDQPIDRPYTVIGELYGIKGSFSSMGDLRNAMAKEARKRGADAIAFTGDTESETAMGEGRYAVGVAGPMERPSFTRTEKLCWALLIKFK